MTVARVSDVVLISQVASETKNVRRRNENRLLRNYPVTHHQLPSAHPRRS